MQETPDRNGTIGFEKPRPSRRMPIVKASLIAVICLCGAIAAVTVLSIVQPPAPEPFTPPSSTPLGKFRTAAVAADGEPCSQIGRDMLLEGGNAMDAAVAALFCIGVVHPQSAGIGGGFLLTVYDSKTGQGRCLNARETAPMHATQSMFQGNASLSQKGALSLGVPGEVAGYWEAHQKYGRLNWSRLVEPSISLAKNGVPVTWHMAAALAQEGPKFKDDPSMKEFIDPKTGQPLKEGDLLQRPVFAETLQRIADNGVNEFYNGSTAQRLVQDVRARGGILTLEDLQNYRPEWQEPVRVHLSGDLTVLASPLPGSGDLAGFILSILDRYRHGSDGVANRSAAFDALTYHRIGEAFKHAYAQRTRLGDPCETCNATMVEEILQVVKNLTLPEFADEAFEKIDDATTSQDPAFYGAVQWQPEDHGTSHVSVLDGDGLAVSATTTINLYFGANFASEQTGIILNDEMDDFSSPNITSAFSIPPSPANFIEPGKRPLSSMVPIVAYRSDTNQTRIVVGAAGGTKITTSVVYTMIRNLWFGETIKEAIDSMRIHHQLFPMTFQYESDFPAQLADSLRDRGHTTSTYLRGAVVSAVTIEDDGFIYANTDWRKTGIAAGIDPVD